MREWISLIIVGVIGLTTIYLVGLGASIIVKLLVGN